MSTGGLWSWPLWVSRALALVLGELNSKKGTPTVEVLNGLEKRDCYVPVGKVSFASRETPWDVWVLSFPSVDLKVAVSWWRKKKEMSVIVWQLVGLSRSVRGSEHFAEHGVKLLPLDKLVASPTLSRSHLKSNKLTAQSGCCMGGGA